MLANALIISAGALMLILSLIYWTKPDTFKEIGQYWQGLGALATVAALLVAAWLYLAERRDRARIRLQVAATAIALPEPRGKINTTLVQVRVTLTNDGLRRAEVKCTNIDIASVNYTPGIERTKEEYHFPSLLHAVDHGKDWKECWKTGLNRSRPSSTSGYIWEPTTIEPGGSDVLFYELMADCKYVALKVLVKIHRVDDTTMDEFKLFVPIKSLCNGSSWSEQYS